jgi:hypothetical protein
MSRFLPAALFILLAFAWCPRAVAEEPVRSLSDHVLKSVAGTLGRDWQPVIQGEPVIEDKGSYKAITLPDLSLRNEKGDVLHIGRIALNAVPAGGEGEWQVRLTLPSPIVLTDPSGRALWQIRPGEQDLSGVYSLPQGTFLSVDGHYRHAGFNDRGIDAALDTVTLTGHVTPAASGQWNGAFHFAADGIHANASQPDANLAAILPAHIGFALDFANWSDNSVSTSWTLHDLAIGNATYDMTGHATQAASPGAPLGLAGTGDLQTKGVSALTNALADEVAQPGLQPDATQLLAEAQAALLVLDLIGKPTPDQSEKLYHIEDTADGQLLVNGQDLQMLLQLMPHKKKHKIHGPE